MCINHGTVTLKEGLIDENGKVVVTTKDIGIVTAYLPDMERFAIMFSDERWFTFYDTEKQFNDRVIWLEKEGVYNE